MACGADGRRAPFVKLNISDVMSCDLLRWRVCSILQRRSDRHWLNSNVSPDACVYVLCALSLLERERVMGERDRARHRGWQPGALRFIISMDARHSCGMAVCMCALPLSL